MIVPFRENVSPSQTVIVNKINIELVRNLLHLPTDVELFAASCTIVHIHILHCDIFDAE